MATIAENLKSIADSKSAIKAAIVAKGVAVSDTDALSTYANKIESISGSTPAPAKSLVAKYWDGTLTALTADDLHGLTEIAVKGATFCPAGTIVFPSTLTTIGKQAFQSAAMTEVTVPSSVTTIGQNAFLYCDNLSVMHLHYKKGGTVLAGAPWGADNCTVDPVEDN